MKQWAHREFVKLVRQNGFEYVRSKGSHDIYYNRQGRHISIPQTLVDVIARRLIRENNLVSKRE
jgi:predicted RNA binding protein YcfA (HicA-like mRNA interferase family)